MRMEQGMRIPGNEIVSNGSDREKMMAAFLNRSYLALRRMVELAPTEDLAKALAAPTDIGGMTLLLSEIGTLQPECLVLDPFAEFLAKGALRKQALIHEAGGAYSTAEVAALLGISRQAVQQRVRRGTLLALTMGQGEYQYPAIQFDENGTIPGLAQALSRFTVTDPWTRLSVLLDTDELLQGRRVIDALREGDLEPALRVIESFGG
jgi:hypothetical protein